MGIRLLLIILLMGLLASGLPAQKSPQNPLQLPWVFSDHMVLQRDQPIPIWGTAPPRASIVGSFGSVEFQATADNHGNWLTAINSLKADQVGKTLRIKSGSSIIEFQDVLVGDVWLCAGQSNMDFALKRAAGGPELFSSSTTSRLIRLCNRTGSLGGGNARLSSEQIESISPDTFFRGSWTSATQENAAGFSAVGAFFSKTLSQHVGIPIGMIDISFGGSSTEGWVSRSSLEKDPTFISLLDNFVDSPLSHPFISERTQSQLASWTSANPGESLPLHFFSPTFFFDSAISSLAPFPLKGVLWYQGESNAHLPKIADKLFRLLVECWRTIWSRPDLPFYFVQLPGMGRNTWPDFRAMQASWEDISDVHMAVSIDVGHPTNVHPTHKEPVGRRLALLALVEEYGLPLVSRGPQWDSTKRKGDELILSFDHAKDLQWDGGKPSKGFEIAAVDKYFFPAKASIKGRSVVLSSPEVLKPAFARYAFAPFPQIGLINGGGLPAAPFKDYSWDPMRIACIGDSITEGYGIENPQVNGYPAVLQRKLGDGFLVKNFGKSGCCVTLSTMRGNWNRAFAKNPEYQQALMFQPDAVICNLGINDIMEWGSKSQLFVGDYVSLIKEFQSLPTEPKVFLWGPLAPLFKGQKFYGSSDEKKIHKGIRRAAKATKSKLINFYDPLVEHGDWFPDHIHPNQRGAQQLAQISFEAIQENKLTPFAEPKIRIYVLTGQSNSLGTTSNPKEVDHTPGDHPSDKAIRFFWSNRSTRSGDGKARLIGDSGDRIQSLTAQQGEGENPEFWGPEIGFARRLFEQGERNFLVVKASRGGGGNGYWSKSASDSHMYKHVIETVESAITALGPHPFEIAALLYLQGESDDAGEASKAEKRLTSLWKNLRKELPNAKSMKLLIGGIAAQGGMRDVVREQQRQVALRNKGVEYFSTLDLAGQLYDGLHFDRQAKIIIGRRFADAWRAARKP